MTEQLTTTENLSHSFLPLPLNDDLYEEDELAVQPDYQPSDITIKSLDSYQLIDTIKPIFNIAAAGLIYYMDKVGKSGKEGQLPWAKAGIGNAAVNLERKMRRLYKAGFQFTKK